MRARLGGVLARRSGAKVRTLEHVDPALLGGLVVRVGGTVYDGSLRARLEELRAKMTGQAAGTLA